MDTRKMVRLSLLVSLATVLSILENQLPIPRPLWLKLGLANVITLLTLYMYGTGEAVIVSCLRALLAGIFGALPMLAFSLPAAITSSLTMGILRSLSRGRLSIVGLSVCGAIAHNLTQLMAAYLILSLNRSSIMALAPLLIIAAVAAGVITGLMARYLIGHLAIIED